MKLSVVIIVKNEEEMIGECLQSVRKLTDEIIVVDGGSEDKTVEIAKKAGAKVLVYPSNDFSQSRNFALRQAQGDWILYVDADERVTPELVQSIKHQISSIKNEEISAYRVKRKNFYLGNHEWPYIEKIERLFKKDALLGWQGKLHESPIVKGMIGELSGFLLHFTHRDLSSMVEKTIEWSEIEAELRFQAGHPEISWWRFPKVMFGEFYNYFIKQKGFKAGTVGIIESIYQAFSIFVTYARLWEKQKDENRPV